MLEEAYLLRIRQRNAKILVACDEALRSIQLYHELFPRHYANVGDVLASRIIDQFLLLTRR